MDTEDPKIRLAEIEAAMSQPDFWNDKDKAQALIKEMQELKDEIEGFGKYDKENAIISIVAGAGGDDAEDFARILHEMYVRYTDEKGWVTNILHENKNDHGGYRNISFEVVGRGAYGTLKKEAGVHRLVRTSPFNSKGARHTSFTLVDIVPELKKIGDLDIPEDDLEIGFAKSSGPGGQNVNKRETAVRITHVPSGVSVHVDSERSQLQNREKAMEMLCGKLFCLLEAEQKKELSELSGTADRSIEWGNQIRSYVLHPYKMVKDHRTGVEVRDVDKVLEGNLQEFIDAQKGLE